jgi:hypothetical protein
MAGQYDILSTLTETNQRYAHYYKDVRNLDVIDVYRVLDLFGVTNPCIQHAIKKLLAAGRRGAKSTDKDINEAIATLVRWQEMQQEDAPADISVL